MASYGNPARLAMLTMSATLPFDSVAKMYLRFIRSRPGTESGHGSSRCPARLRWSRSASPSPLIPNSATSFSRLSRCRTSSFTNGRRPLRTSSMAGWYMPRQRSANCCQSTPVIPRDRPKASPSRKMLERQSTTVPNTSNVSALIAISVHLRPLLLPRPRLLEGRRRLEHREIGEATAHHLEPDGQTGLGKAGGQRAGRLAGEVERIGERRPGQPIPGMLRPVLGVEPAERKGRHRHRRRQQQVVLLEERPHRIPVRHLLTAHVDVLRHAHAQAVLDARDETGIHLLPPLGQ